MSNEIKQGDKVRVSKDAPRIYTPDWVDAMFDLVLKVTEVEDGNAMAEFAKRTPYRTVLTAIPTKYLVKVDAEAKEANVKIGSDKWVDKTVWNYKNHKKGVIRRMTDGVAEIFTEDGRLQTWQIEDLVDEYDDPIEKWKYPEATQPTEQTDAEKPNIGSIKIPVEVDLADSYWDAYAAGLAKEIALKVANKYNDPKEAAKYAVSVAKAVVEGLKRK